MWESSPSADPSTSKISCTWMRCNQRDLAVEQGGKKGKEKRKVPPFAFWTLLFLAWEAEEGNGSRCGVSVRLAESWVLTLTFTSTRNSLHLQNEAGNPQGNKLPHEPPAAKLPSTNERRSGKQHGNLFCFPHFSFLFSVSPPFPSRSLGQVGGSCIGCLSNVLP